MEGFGGGSPGLRARMALKKHGFRFTHSLGQNFLLDDELVGRLVDAAGVSPGDRVLEIGPGAGVMTAAMAARGARVLAVELDQSLEPVLREVVPPSVRVIFADAMKLDLDGAVFRELGPGAYRVVANLPYYITTDLIERMIRLSAPPEDICVMVQKEAAERILSAPGEKSYCAIAATARLYGTAEALMTLPAEAFVPRPRVTSCFLRIRRHERQRPAGERALMLRLIGACFAMRRKTLANNLASAFGVTREEAVGWLAAAELDERVRGEALTIEALAALARAIGGALEPSHPAQT